MSENTLIEQNQPRRFEWRNFRRAFRHRQIGSVYLISVEVDADTWNELETMPDDADGEGVIWWTERAASKEPTPKKPKGPKGPYGYMWEYLNPNSKYEGRGFVEIPAVAAAIAELRRSDTEPAWDLLHRVFGVGGTTLANTSDQAVLAKFPDNREVKKAVERAMAFQLGKLTQVTNTEDEANG